MGRPLNPDLTKYWKISLPATLAGTVEFYLFDRLHNKPQYGARARLIQRLLEGWIEEQRTSTVPPTRMNEVRDRLQSVADVLRQSPGNNEDLAVRLEACIVDLKPTLTEEPIDATD